MRYNNSNSSDYGVNVDALGNLSGLAWGANIGWINWHPSAANGAVVGQLFLSGHLWSANCGWISLGSGSPANGFRYQNNGAADFGVNVNPNGSLSGYAYGANIGWIRFSEQTASGSLPATQIPQLDLKTGRLGRSSTRTRTASGTAASPAARCGTRSRTTRRRSGRS